VPSTRRLLSELVEALRVVDDLATDEADTRALSSETQPGGGRAYRGSAASAPATAATPSIVPERSSKLDEAVDDRRMAAADPMAPRCATVSATWRGFRRARC
jgi:hypothetical protein